MIPATEDLPERTLPKTVKNFITISQLIMIDDKIIASLIIVAVVICRSVWTCRFLVTLSANEIHRWVIQYLLALVL